MTKNWYENISVMINNHGDPLTDNQVESTVNKSLSMKGYKNTVGICTKAVPSDFAFKELERLKGNNDINLFLAYSLTGLDEGGYSFDERVDVIKRMYDMFGQMTILLRPLIKGQNDSKENIERIVKVAASTSGRIILGGLHNRKLQKQLKDESHDYFIDCCNHYNVKYFNKTSCAIANQYSEPCKVHDLSENPINLDVLDSLGYKYEILDGKIVLYQASVGDLNLIRYITNTLPYTQKLTTRLNKISTVGNHNYELTSGWLSWSNNVYCDIQCSYCVMSLIDYLADGTPVGCHPKNLVDIRIDNTEKDAIDIDKKELYISYKDCRVIQECMKYD